MRKTSTIKTYHETGDGDVKNRKTRLWAGGVLALLAVGAAAIYLTDVDLTRTAKLPDVSVEGGQMPKMDVDVADVDVGTRPVSVKVPTISITPPQEGSEADDLGDNIDVDVDADVDADVEPDPR